MLGNGLPALLIRLDQQPEQLQLGADVGEQFLDELERLLAGEAIEQTNKPYLVGKPKLVVGTAALTDVDHVLVGECGGLDQLLSGVGETHARSVVRGEGRQRLSQLN